RGVYRIFTELLYNVGKHARNEGASMELGNQLQKLREKHDMSQQDLADKLNVSRQAIYKWENNKGYPDIENLIALSDVFQVTVDEMIRSDDKLREKINVDEDDSSFNDPGFYIGIVIMFIGILTDFGSVSTVLMFLGIAIIVFYQDGLNVLKRVIRDLKDAVKG